MTFIYREKEHRAWLIEQKNLLLREQEEKCLIKAAKKRLTTIQRDINKNNKWLMKQK